MRTILILGGNGTLGRYLSIALDKKFNILKFNKRFRCNEQHQTEIFNLIKNRNVDFVINAVGATDVKRCEEDEKYAYEGNILVPKVISKIQDRLSRTLSVINFSTDQVYDGSGNSGELDFKPINNYGHSKLLGEQKLVTNCCNLRINYVSSSKTRLSFSDWIIDTASSNKPVTLFTDVYFNPVDLNTIVACVEKVLHEKVEGTFNIGATQKISKAEFYMKFSKRLGFHNFNVTLAKYYDIFETPRPLDMSMNVEKALGANFALPNLEVVMLNLKGN